MDQMTESASTDIPPVITELADIPPKIVPPKPKPQKESRVVLKDTYIARCIMLENELAAKKAELGRKEVEIEQLKEDFESADKPLSVFGMGCAAVAGAIIGALVSKVCW